MEVFIPGTNEQYSITDGGIIYSNYKYRNNGVKALQRREIIKYKSSQTHTSSLITLYVDGRNKTFMVNTLMVQLFNINKPDNHHYYDITNINGDIFNCCVENIGFKIRMEKNNGYKFYPQPYYNESGRITHKVCGICGEKKPIKHFHLQRAKKKGHQRTYRNACESCRAHRQWAWIRSDEKRTQRANNNRIRWEKSEKGQEFRKQYAKDKHQYEYKHLTPHYITTSLRFYLSGLSQNDVTPEIIELARKRIKLYRKRRQIKLLTKNNTNGKEN